MSHCCWINWDIQATYPAPPSPFYIPHQCPNFLFHDFQTLGGPYLAPFRALPAGHRCRLPTWGLRLCSMISSAFTTKIHENSWLLTGQIGILGPSILCRIPPMAGTRSHESWCALSPLYLWCWWVVSHTFAAKILTLRPWSWVVQEIPTWRFCGVGVTTLINRMYLHVSLHCNLLDPPPTLTFRIYQRIRSFIN